MSEFNLEENYKKVNDLRNYLVGKLKDIEEVTLNSDEKAIPYVINFSIGKIKAETMLNFLSSKGVYVSGGSACAKGKKSRVLKNVGFEDERVTSSIRVSFSKYNTKQDVDDLIKYLKEGLATLARS